MYIIYNQNFLNINNIYYSQNYLYIYNIYLVYIL